MGGRDTSSVPRRSGPLSFFKQRGGKNKKRSGRRLRGRTYDKMPVANVLYADDRPAPPSSYTAVISGLTHLALIALQQTFCGAAQ
jgi:hypothetical protein